MTVQTNLLGPVALWLPDELSLSLLHLLVSPTFLFLFTETSVYLSNEKQDWSTMTRHYLLTIQPQMVSYFISTSSIPSNSYFNTLIPLIVCKEHLTSLLPTGICSYRTFLKYSAPLRFYHWTKSFFTWLRHLLSGHNNMSWAFSWWQDAESRLTKGAFNIIVQTIQMETGCKLLEGARLNQI